VCEAATIRVLFCTTAGYGHLHPLVPLASAFADEGHEVAVATSAAMREHVAALGFRTLEAGMDPDVRRAMFAPYRQGVEALPIPERRPVVFTRLFATLEAPAKIAPLRKVVEGFVPDLVVHEPCDLAAPIVATLLGVPRVHHSFGRLVPAACYERGTPEVEQLWRSAGLEPEPLCGAFGCPYVDICPPSFQTEELPEGTPRLAMHPEFPVRRGEAEPEWLGTLPRKTTVYLTLGTAFNDLPHFRLILDALSKLDCNVVATIGHTNDPAELEPIPANARVERYVSQALVLRHAGLVVSHAGSGAMLATFAAGLPALLLPQGADQFENAGRCVELGAGLVLMPSEVTRDAVRDAVQTLLAEPSFRDRAREMAAEIAAMPAPRDVARRLAESR
jgi:UDP:flavonoid glycosyltransferase YjiC (YdhE family)